MGTEYVYEDENGNEYVYEAVDDNAPASEPPIDVDSARATPTGSKWERFYDELSDPDALSKTVLGAPKAGWEALKGLAGMVGELPQAASNIYNDPMGAIERNGIKALGAAGSAAARFNPLGFLTGPAYDKLLQKVAPEDFPETSPEQDAAKVRGEVLAGATGLGIARGAQAATSGLQRLGAGLKNKLTTQVVPERRIPEITADYTEFKPVPSIEDAITPAAAAKAAKRGKQIIGDKIVTQLDDALAENRGIVELPPEQSFVALEKAKTVLQDKIDDLVDSQPKFRPTKPAQVIEEQRVKPGRDTGLVDESGNPIRTPDELVTSKVNIPEEYDVPTPKVDKFLAENIPDPIERAALIEDFVARKTAKMQEFGGDVRAIHEWRKATQQGNSGVYSKGLGDKIRNPEKLDKLLAEDLNDALRSKIDGYEQLNNKFSKLLRIEPFVARRNAMAKKIQAANEAAPIQTRVVQKGETIPEQRTPGAWAQGVNRAARIMVPGAMLAKGNPLGAAAAFGGLSALENTGGVANLIGQGAGMGSQIAGAASKLAGVAGRGLGAGAVGPLAGMAQESTMLPRDTERFDESQVANFLMATAQTPQAPIAQQLAEKMRRAIKAQDMDTVEKLHSDMARLFPDAFEPGMGINGKLFYPDEQKKYMDNLIQLNRMGQVDSIHLAKQQNAFNNPQDGRMLPLPESLNRTRNAINAVKNTFNGESRVYGY